MAVKTVRNTCVYCGAGCQIDFTVDTDTNKIVKAVPAMGRTNQGTLCLKGHYGWDFTNDPQILSKRVTSPMIRRGGKGGKLEPCSWDEAIQFVVDNLTKIKAKYGANSIMGTASARSPGNEAVYVMQKFMRACIGTNNIDHCARI